MANNERCCERRRSSWCWRGDFLSIVYFGIRVIIGLGIWVGIWIWRIWVRLGLGIDSVRKVSLIGVPVVVVAHGATRGGRAKVRLRMGASAATHHTQLRRAWCSPWRAEADYAECARATRGRLALGAVLAGRWFAGTRDRRRWRTGGATGQRERLWTLPARGAVHEKNDGAVPNHY